MIVQTKLFVHTAPFEFECGRTIPSLSIAYETYGCLTPEKDNAILICHALSGDAHAAGKHSEDDKKPGWWDSTIGPGKAIDTERYFVICSNVVGGCAGSTGPTSIDPETGERYGARFPLVTIQDMVSAQAKLIDYFGIETLLAVVGGSMGGMQALMWAKRYPARVYACIPIASALYQSAQNIALHEVGRRSIISDPNFHDGAYYEKRAQPDAGLAIARMVGHISYLSDELFRSKFGRKLQGFDHLTETISGEFQVESYLGYKGQSFTRRFDANSYLLITRAIDHFDIGYGKSPEETLSGATAQFLALSFSSDWLYPPYQSKEIVNACKANNLPVTYYEILSAAGHDAFLLKNETMEDALRNFIDRAYAKRQNKPLPPAPRNAYKGRYDYALALREVKPNTRALDLGSGDGTLMEALVREKNARVQGVEIDRDNFLSCVRKGMPVIEDDLQKALVGYPAKSFDYVILNMSLQVTTNSKGVLDEALRVGKRVIVSFPNFIYYENILWLVFRRRMPKTKSLPFEWYETPNIHLVTIKDFKLLCKKAGYRIARYYAYGDKGPVWFLPGLFAKYSMFVLEK